MSPCTSRGTAPVALIADTFGVSRRDRSATPESHFHPCYFAAAASHARCDPGQPAAT